MPFMFGKTVLSSASAFFSLRHPLAFPKSSAGELNIGRRSATGEAVPHFSPVTLGFPRGKDQEERLTMWSCRPKSVPQIQLLIRSSNTSWLRLFSSPFSDAAALKRSKVTPLQERKMIDRFVLHVKGGDGGSGCSSLRRSRHARHGRPDGGNGGRGGDVILQCTSAMWDFRGLPHHINGKRGENGASKNKIGSRGEDKVVQVPVGTVIHLVEGEISSVIERQYTGYSDPWDIPGTLTSDALESSQQSTCSSLNDRNIEVMGEDEPPSFSFIGRGIQRSAGAEETSYSFSQLLPPGLKSRHPHKLILSDNVEHNGGDEVTSDNDDDGDCRIGNEGEWRDENEKIQYNVGELTEEGQQIIVAHGGAGGLGNILCSNMSTREENASGVENRPLLNVGLPGSEAVLILELKTIADVGLVGMPNAGKSTLLGAISRAKPAVGNYAFTTLRPNIGKLKYEDFSVTVADIPGLIKGAHENRGLGHAFLRHIERTKILAYVVDLAAGLEGTKGIPPWEQLKVLVSELEHYREGLTNRPSLVIANKTDEAGAGGVYEELHKRVQGIPVYPVCAILEEGIAELKDGLRQLVNDGGSAQLSLKSILID